MLANRLFKRMRGKAARRLTQALGTIPMSSRGIVELKSPCSFKADGFAAA